MNFEDYGRSGKNIYGELAEAIARILTSAIHDESVAYRLQQIQARAKQPDSLKKKLEERDLADTNDVEASIKDLAGCRVIFYTDNDVSKFIGSGIIKQNFNVLDFKLHYPQRDIDDDTEPYTAMHYLVTLCQARLALPEYNRFVGMRCEIQIQTVLHHAWAEMAHDTIYKAPKLTNFGNKELEDIKMRMKKVAQKYLVPAGYEFQKIATDFQRLLNGKKLYDGGAIESIVDSPNNNARWETIKKFA